LKIKKNKISKKTDWLISGEFDVLMHSGSPYPKGYKSSTEIGNKQQTKNMKQQFIHNVNSNK